MVDIWTQELAGRQLQGSKSKRDNTNTNTKNTNTNTNTNKYNANVVKLIVSKCYTPNADVIVVDRDTLPGNSDSVSKFLNWCGSGYTSLEQIFQPHTKNAPSGGIRGSGLIGKGKGVE